MDPETDSFRQFQDFAEKLAETDSDRPLAMFCTGGIRCEKAAALMQELGFSEVYQLQGGILNYLENVPDSENQCSTNGLPSTRTWRRVATCSVMPAGGR
jgi:UPF0176 protein